jgi:hypothetical protein
MITCHLSMKAGLLQKGKGSDYGAHVLGGYCMGTADTSVGKKTNRQNQIVR